MCQTLSSFSQDSSNSSDYLSKVFMNEQIFSDFPLKLGWALKSNQKYGKKGGGKRIGKRVWVLLEGYFLQGNLDKSNWYKAETMLENLHKKVEEEELEDDEILKLETIQGWIARYAAQHRQIMAEKALEVASSS